MTPPESNAGAQRQEGRALACDGLLASRFGRRASVAGSRALEQLRSEEQAATAPGFAHRGAVRPAVRTGDRWAGRWGLGGPASGSRPRWAWAAFATCLALFLGVAYLVLPKLGRAEATLEARGRGITIARGSASLAAEGIVPLKRGDVLRVPRGAQAVVRGPQGTVTLHLPGETELVLARARGEPRFMLQAGTADVEVARRPTLGPVVVATPQAEARCPWGVFSLSARPSRTWLAVERGQVDFQQAGRPLQARVGPREYAVAGADLELTAHRAEQRWQTPYELARAN